MVDINFIRKHIGTGTCIHAEWLRELCDEVERYSRLEIKRDASGPAGPALACSTALTSLLYPESRFVLQRAIPRRLHGPTYRIVADGRIWKTGNPDFTFTVMFGDDIVFMSKPVTMTAHAPVVEVPWRIQLLLPVTVTHEATSIWEPSGLFESDAVRFGAELREANTGMFRRTYAPGKPNRVDLLGKWGTCSASNQIIVDNYRFDMLEGPPWPDDAKEPTQYFGPDLQNHLVFVHGHMYAQSLTPEQARTQHHRDHHGPYISSGHNPTWLGWTAEQRDNSNKW